MLYKINNMTKSYDGQTVLDIKDISIEKEKVIGLLGPNGSGKTTLMEILAFLLEPASGELWYEDSRVNFSRGKLIDLRRKVVLVQQQPILFTTTVFNNVELPLKIRRVDKQKRPGIVEELLSLVGMEGFRYAKAHKLSGGETQRVAIAQALACSPEVILLDEPTGSVDVENRIIIERIMRDINREKRISVIFTTHDMVQASRMADEIVFLFDGKVTESIYENIYSGRIETGEGGQKYCILQGGLKFNVETERSGFVRVSINPEAIIISRDKGDNILKGNIFQGRMIQLTDERSRVRALVDIGIPLSVLMPREASMDLHLGLGEEVWLSISPEGFGVF